MDEKFKTSLELDISKFKEGIERVKETFKNVGNVAKKDVVMDTNNLKEYSNEQKYIMSQIDDIKHKLDLANKGFEVGDVLKLEADLDRLNSKLNDTNKQVNKLGNIGEGIKKGFDKGMKSAKRFTLSLFGIQSVYRMLSRASSSYLSQDEETSRKVQSAWIGLGSIFAPLLEKMANFVIKIVSYLNVFWKALFGVDFLAKAMAKSMDKANKSAKAMHKTMKSLGGMDEITNIGDTSGGGLASGIDTSWTDAFAEVELDAGVVEWLENIATKMQPIVDFIKDAFTWIIENKEMVLGFILGLSIAIGVLSGNWQNKIMALGIGLAIAGIIKLVKELIEWIKNPSWEQFTKVLDGLALALIGVGIAMIAFNATNPVGWIILAIGAVVALTSTIIKNWDWIKEKSLTLIKWFKSSFPTLFYIITEPFKNAWNTIKGVWGGAKQFFGGIKDLFVGIFTLDGNKIKNGLKQMLQGMGNIIISFIEGAINGFLIPINSAIKLINKIPGVNIPIIKVTIPRIPKLDVGTNYVPEDTLAMIHKGEAVVPKKFNSSEYFGSGNEETNNLLRVLIETLEEKDMSVNIDKKAIGQASADYINSQKRIMGRGVI